MFWFYNVFQVTAKAVVNSRVSSSEKRRSGGDRCSGDFANWDIDTVSYNCIAYSSLHFDDRSKQVVFLFLCRGIF